MKNRLIDEAAVQAILSDTSGGVDNALFRKQSNIQSCVSTNTLLEIFDIMLEYKEEMLTLRFSQNSGKLIADFISSKIKLTILEETK